MINTNMTNNQDSLNNVILEMEKKYGKGSAVFLGAKSNNSVESVSTGIPSLDNIIGVKGYPKGRIVEIYGPESSGKTTIALHAVTQAQKEDKVVAYIDLENALDPKYAQAIGVDLQNMIIAQPNSGEQALDIVEHLVKNNQVDLVIIDSVAALVPVVELESNMEDQQMGAQARLMSRGLRKINAALANSKTIVIFINQLRDKIGIMFGNPEVTSGGKALKYYSSLRIDVRKDKSIKDVELVTGNYIKAKIVKNKVGIPFLSTTLRVNYGEGVDILEDIINEAVTKKILVKKGSWFSYMDKNIAQGIDRLKEYLNNDQEFKNKINQEIKCD
ncbi:DNA recombination/repair protein RecA [Mycoplasma sp. (ex Biomphalaria glabrata)]|nr:recombinase RecA [Mycoplasma sp. (ex Biomphalaria glabrata)]ALV23600.1 DNA recombination/repair protein RecA [Mycoplasma sp. (ex Biomphalaria glabrata)]